MNFNAIVFCLLLYQCTSIRYLIPSENVTGKFDKIYFPREQGRSVYGITYDYSIIVAPFLPVNDKKFASSLEFCSLGKRSLPVNTTCFNYFCSNNTPVHLKNATLSIKRHWDVLTYCSLCSESGNNNLTLISLSSPNNTCKWIDVRGICSQAIHDNDTICIPFVTTSNVKAIPAPMYYYFNEEKFYGVRDFTTLVFIPALDVWIPVIFTFLFIIMLIITIALVVIPEIIFLIMRVNPILGCWVNFTSFIGYRTHSMLWYLLSGLVCSSFFIAYSLGLTGGERYKTELIIGMILSMFISVLSYVSILVLWVYTIQQTETINTVKTTPIQKLVIIILYSFMIIVSIIGFSLRAVINRNETVEILYGIWLIAFMIILTIVTICFFIIGIVLFVKIKKTFKGQSEVGFGQLRFTRIMIAIDVFVSFFIIYLFLFSILQFSELDLMGYHVLFLSDVFLYLWLFVYSVLTFIILFDPKRFVFIYNKCLNKESD